MTEPAALLSERAPVPPSLLMITTVATTVTCFLLPYAAHFRSLGWRVDVASNGATQDPRILDAFDHVYDLPLSRSIRDISALRRGGQALGAILDTAPDIVHVHTPIAGFLTRFVGRGLSRAHRPAIVYTAHGFHFYDGGNPATNAAFLIAERIAGRWTDRLIVINKEDERAALRHRIVARDRLVHMPGIGLATGWYAPLAVPPEKKADLRAQLGIPADAPVFTVVGELNPNKRQRDPIAALGLMSHPGAHLVLLGDGNERAALEAQALHLGVARRLHLLGKVLDIRPAVAMATALILPSKREGLARSVMEALSLEVPVIGSSARGNRELIGGDAGIVYPTGDVAALAVAMDDLIDHPLRAKAMGIRGRERMVERYDLAVLEGLHETLYTEMLMRRPNPRS